MKLMNKSYYILLLISLGNLAVAERSAPFSLSVGTQSVGVRYQFTEECALVESAREVAALGSDTLKIALTPNYPDDYRLEKDACIDSVMDLVRHKPSYQQVMDMPFRNIMLWVYPFSDSKSAFSEGAIGEKEAKDIYKEIYDFTAYLLKRYSGSNKAFFIGNWEGDWHLQNEAFDYDLDPDPEAITGAIQWFNLREKAVADARRDTPHEAVEVFYYIELNHVAKSLDDDKPSIVNRVLPHIRTDYVSWSSYDVTKPAALLGGEKGRKRVFQALDYIESHLPESEVPGKRVFIGEYGFELLAFKTPEKQRQYTADIMKWSLEWGCPFILYWELYCNEIDAKTGGHRGYWLINDEGEKQPAWYLHKAFLDRGKAFLGEYQGKHGKMPCQQTYNRAAATWIEELVTADK